MIGYLPEERGLYLDVPILKSLIYLASIRGMDKAEAKKAAESWLERFELTDRANEKLQTLSKGNQQKIQFAAAILHKPVLAILDEPFSGLDPLNQEKFLGYIQELNRQGTTIILSAHQMPLVEKIAHSVFLINEGKELYQGSMANLLQKEGQQKTLIAHFSQKTAPDCIDKLSGLHSVQWESPQTARLQFGRERDFSQILAELALIPGIAEIHSEKTTLHDIFINMMGRKQ
jgi:ABC-2 type transport system ATP-binding protein